MSSLAFPLLFIFAIVSQVVGELTLAQVVVVSRHGIRTPYAPENGTVSDFSSYTNKVFPDADAWGMSEEAFSEQYLTPWGEVAAIAYHILPIPYHFVRVYRYRLICRKLASFIGPDTKILHFRFLLVKIFSVIQIMGAMPHVTSTPRLIGTKVCITR